MPSRPSMQRVPTGRRVNAKIGQRVTAARIRRGEDAGLPHATQGRAKVAQIDDVQRNINARPCAKRSVAIVVLVLSVGPR